jgi:hypothetical protein
MMGIGDDYRPDDNYGSPRGEQRVIVIGAFEKQSRSGKDMVEIEFQLTGRKMAVKTYLVQGEYFNARATEFFDAFGIQRGNFNYREWIGKTGYVFLGENERGFAEVKRLIVKRTEITASDGPAPNDQPPVDSYEGTAPFKEDIPF